MATGPSSSASPYLTAIEPNVRFTSIATANDIIGTKPDSTPYRFVGVPDGIGAYDNGNGTITVLVNHEIGATAGVVREHGSAGSFVSQLVIDKTTLAVISAKDAFDDVFNNVGGTFIEGTSAFARFCSGDLALPTAFYNAATGLGSQQRIYLTGEEAGPEGRGVAIVLGGAEAGNLYQLAALGRFSWENAVANPFAQNKTIVAGTDDATPGQVYIYVGDKQATGIEVVKAGLTGGITYGIKAAEIGNSLTGTQEVSSTTPLGADNVSAFTLVNLGDVTNLTGAALQTASNAAGVSEFFRPEDSAWDPSNPNWLYFATTANFNSTSHLYRLEFTDITNPELGGTLRVLTDGTEGYRMFDNLSVGPDGKVHLVEDVGNNPRLGLVWEYDPATDTLAPLAQFDAARFLAPTPPFSQDEEASGIIDVTALLGNAHTQAFLLDAQAHYNIGIPEIVEGGQLLAMFIDEIRDGGSGNDRVAGDQNDNMLNGNAGNDLVLGGSGNDVLLGARGNDALDGGRGNDVLQGGLDADTFVFDQVFAGTVDHITDYQRSQGDTLSFGPGVTVSSVAVGFNLGGNTANGFDLRNSGGALDLQITLTSGAGNQTLFILDAYNKATDAYWDTLLGFDVPYSPPFSTASNLQIV